MTPPWRLSWRGRCRRTRLSLVVVKPRRPSLRPQRPPSFSQEAQKLSRQLLFTYTRLRKKETQLAAQRAELEGMQAVVAQTEQEIQELRSMQPEVAPSTPQPDPESVFYDRVLTLLQSEGREAGAWDQLVVRVRELNEDAASAAHLREEAARRRAKNNPRGVAVYPLTDGEDGAASEGDDEDMGSLVSGADTTGALAVGSADD